jgi:hypothetical protein
VIPVVNGRANFALLLVLGFLEALSKPLTQPPTAIEPFRPVHSGTLDERDSHSVNLDMDGFGFVLWFWMDKSLQLANHQSDRGYGKNIKTIPQTIVHKVVRPFEQKC